ncbi:uncharacterized protein LOC142162286 [Nicotiana tabacum]|uniref:Uncharacterized protein LOC142162286 n=1 Tax=Nicotiana tabacum TaxID=4097 RepID=A0AC58RPT1_TOBAC
MQESPTGEEIKEPIFSMEPNSASGPDEFNGFFFQVACGGAFKSIELIELEEEFKGFHIRKQGPHINHLCYAYDLVIFTSGDKRSIKMIMDQLSKYQLASGTEINQDKSQFYTQEGTKSHIIRRIKRCTGYKQANFPFTYLVCPIYTSRKKICHFTKISNKVMNKVGGWQGRFLSKGDMAIIIKYILQSQTYPKATLDQIEMYFSNFFWGQRDGKNNYHWSSCGKMCYPIEEGGVGFKSLHDICNTFLVKRWWRLRTEDTLWAKFMEAKYCIRSNIMSRGISPTDFMAWKHLVKIRDKVEVNIMWKIYEGNLLFWWDDWTSQGSIKHILYLSSIAGSTKVKDFIVGNEWNLELIAREVPDRAVNTIQGVALGDPMARDLAIWEPSTNGRFSCGTAFQTLRQKRALTHFLSKVWVKEIPFKISFFMWRMLKNRLPLDDRIQLLGLQVDSNCCF